MAQDRVFRFDKVTIFKDEGSQLGVGSYGAVYKAKCDQLPCAAKILHPVLFQTNDPGSRKILERFEQECGFLSSIRHPNIVQYLGMCRDHDSQLPVLLIELLDSSLTKYLETSQNPLSYHVQVDLCFDIALAIAYLHSNGIIHRDLSGNNVLIVAGSRAKVTDFGMSKLVDASSRITHRILTECPGTEVYMPPEAIIRPPIYTNMLDCFSFGVLVIQTLTRLYPNPGPRTQLVSFPASPTGKIEMPLVETERRKDQIETIDPSNPLLSLATDCLKYNHEERPAAQQLCEQLATLKEEPQYSESRQKSQEFGLPAENGFSQTIQELQKQVKEKDLVIQKKDDIIQENNHVIQTKVTVIEDFERVVLEKDGIISDLNRQLKEKAEMVTEMKKALTEKEERKQEVLPVESDIDSPQHQLQQVSPEVQHVAIDEDIAEKNKVKLCWRDGGNALEKVYSGSCTVDGDMLHCKDDTKIQSHSLTTGEWEIQPKCPNRAFSLVVVKGWLTAVGGFKRSSHEDSNKLLSLLPDGKWTEQFPHMPTKRRFTVAICSGKTLVVIGGRSGDTLRLKTVELLDLDTLQWYIARELPHSLSEPSATVCGDNLYLVGGFGESGRATKSVLTCSLSALVKTARPATIGGLFTLKRAGSQPDDIWRAIANLPAVLSTCTSVKGQLIAVGGIDSDDKRTNAIYAYDTLTDRWEVISTMPTARSSCLAATVPRNELVVVGGFTSGEMSSATDKVEIATF